MVFNYRREIVNLEQKIDLVNIYTYLTPIALFLILLEMLYCYFFKKNYISFSQAITNLGTAIGNQCVNLGVAYVVITVFGKIYDYRFFTIPTTLLNFVILLIAFDGLFYWFHRHGHSINILWAAHMPHHSSEEFNLFVGLRASITQRLFSFSYMWPLALMGFEPAAIYAASAVQLIIAFWHHTRVIKKMGWFEIIFNSPSYHRIHHAINEKYLDKNFGEIFILWDKMFGTCVKEDEEPVYGCLTPVNSLDPNKIYVQYWKMLYTDMMNTRSWKDKVKLWFMPLGWRPLDVKHIERHRVNEKTIKPFMVEVSPSKKIYLASQGVLALILMGITINLDNHLDLLIRFSLIFLLWLMITSWGKTLEDKKEYGILEILRLIFTFIIFMHLMGESSQELNLIYVLAIIMTTGFIQLALHLKLRPLPQMKN